jgi:hypothetical protein
MKFLRLLVWFVLFMALVYVLNGNSPYLTTAVVLVLIAWIVFLIIKRHKDRTKLPGGTKGARLQGIWVLEKHLRFDPVLKKWETLPVEEKKNYFEFKGSSFCSGDFDEKHKQLPADYSPFSIEGDSLILESEFLKKANWKWIIKRGCLELTGEISGPKYSKSQFIFYRKNWY